MTKHPYSILTRIGGRWGRNHITVATSAGEALAKGRRVLGSRHALRAVRIDK